MKMESVNAKSPATSASSSQSGHSSHSASAGGGSATGSLRRYRETAHFANIMVEFENNTREMAVDVPDSFIAHTKTPPKYPPPRTGSGSMMANGVLNSSGRSHHSNRYDTPPPPALNARDHLRIERDGHLLNTREGPSPARDRKILANNGGSRNNSYVRPDEQQSQRIQMYTEELARRNLEQERRERNDDFLRHSIRNSQKMNALKESNGKPMSPNHITGVSNVGFVREEDDDSRLIHVPDLSELAQTVGRLETVGVVNGDLSVLLNSLVSNPEFSQAVLVNQKIQKLRPHYGLSPVLLTSQDLAEEVINDLEDLTFESEEDESDRRELLNLLCKEDFEALLCSHDKIAQRRHQPSQSQAQIDQEALLERLSHYTEPNIKVVRIEKTSDPLGATVRNEDDGAVIVGRIIRGGTAEATGLLHEGDEILEVNEVPMRGKNVNEVCDILSDMKGTLTLLVVPSRQHLMMPYEVNNTGNKPAPIMHVKAHIDYDPVDDPYVPCRDLGLSFLKGDILHVISQKDPHWWQAKREGDEENQLAGLIPSADFQQQREAVKHTIAHDVEIGGGGHGRHANKTTGFLCAKRSGRRKRNKGQKGRRLGMDDADLDAENNAEDVITYEEVAMFYPTSDRKRPVVLIGPPNIGRHELRQRLMQDSERFAAAIPHTSRPKRADEIDGQDYHFITRLRFEQDIISRKFVEHGEYEKAYYGTSLAAIRAVVQNQKICVLNLHPQSLKILKNSDLMPFVVFVAPPSMEKLRKWKLERSMEQVDDAELKDIIERAREMEDVYGHYFDMVIIYSDPERAYQELLREINLLEREPQWVPAAWLDRIPRNSYFPN